MQTIGKNIFSLGISRVVSGAIIILVHARLANYLGAEDFGRFALVLAFYTIFLLVVDIGMSKYVIKKVSEDRTRASLYLGNFLVAELFVSVVVLLLFIIMPKILGYDFVITRSMLLVGIGLFIGSLAIPFASIVQAWQRIQVVAAINFFRTLINAAWLAVAIFLTRDLIFVFWVYIVMGLFEAMAYILMTRKIVLPDFRPRKELINKMLLFGLPFGFISGFEILIGKIDVVIQKFFLPFFEVGQYSAAYRFLDILTFIPAIVAISIFPYIAEKVILKTTDVKATISRLNRYMVALAIPLGVASSIVPEKIVFSLFNPDKFVGAVVPFQILIWASVLTFIYAVPNVVMIVKKTRLAVIILAIVTTLNIVLNIIFVPVFGIIASAWITVASYLLITAAYVIYSRQLVDYPLFRFFLWPVVASLVMGGVVWFLREFNIIVLILVSVVIYFGLLSLVKFFQREDWIFLKSIFQRTN